MKKIYLVFALSFVAMILFAHVVHDYHLEMPQIKQSPFGLTVSLAGAESIALPGEPDLPFFGYSLLLPKGSEAKSVSIHRSCEVRIDLDNIIAPAQTQYPLSYTKIETPDAPNPEIYKSHESFPQDIARGMQTQFMNGHSIAFGTFSPFDYYPLTNELVFYTNIRVEIAEEQTPRANSALRFLKEDSFVIDKINKTVQNPIPNNGTRYSEGNGIEYLMIIDATKASIWQDLVSYYENIGISCTMKSVSQIISSTAGRDDQEKIRNYIIDFYENNPLRYVLLAGDVEVIPHRGFYVNMGSNSQVDDDIPADMYYSCLDGTWNTNNNSYWGETHEADLTPEFAIGRICYNSDQEIQNQIHKIVTYQMTPVEDAIKSVFFCGEWLWEGPTWGGDYMDEMIGGSSMHGYATTGVPTDWNITKLYDRTSNADNSWGASQVRPLLSQGSNLVNHLGHSFTTYNMRLSNRQITSTTITNNGVNNNYSIHFTQGCYAGSFDNRETGAGQYTSDCVTEKFTSISTSAAGMISHSRYGWGVQNSTNGASQKFHRQYMDALFGKDIYELGWSLVRSKVANIPYINQPVMYWVTYETNLFGCPATKVWTDTPEYMSVNMPQTWMMGLTHYQVNTSAQEAYLKLKQGDNILYEATSASGVFSIDLISPLMPGEYQIYLTAPGFYPHSADIIVTAEDIPYISTDALIFPEDDMRFHSGENVVFGINVSNVGTSDQLEDGIFTIVSLSENIQVVQGSYNFSALEAGEEMSFEDVFEIAIVGNFPDNSQARFKIVATYDGHSSQSTHWIRLAAPFLALDGYQIVHNGSFINPGDTVGISFNMKNTGSGRASYPMLILFPNDNIGSADVFDVSLEPIEAGETQTYEMAFNVIISPDAEAGDITSIGYMLSAENGDVTDGDFRIPVGAATYSFESDLQGWAIATLNNQFVNQWHRTDQRNYTSGGEYSIKFGSTGSGDYSGSSFGAFVSPFVQITPNSKLKFYHWMDAEKNSSNQSQAWDGGTVQMSMDGGVWQTIIPVGGYPYSVTNNPASPFEAGTLVFSGNFDWREEVFELGNISGMAQFRFVFGSDAYVHGEGWYLDDIFVEVPTVSNPDGGYAVVPLLLHQNYPNPFNPETTISFNLPKADEVLLNVYNIKGQLVKTLVNSSFPHGNHTVVWDGTNHRGEPVSSGIYTYRITYSGQHISKKMMLIK